MSSRILFSSLFFLMLVCHASISPAKELNIQIIYQDVPSKSWATCVAMTTGYLTRQDISDCEVMEEFDLN